MTNSASHAPESQADFRAITSESPRRRIVDRLDRRLVNTLTVLGFAVPIVSYYWFLGRYSIDIQ